jgi:hypothetical protein
MTNFSAKENRFICQWETDGMKGAVRLSNAQLKLQLC